jgi:hypothetical protein
MRVWPIVAGAVSVAGCAALLGIDDVGYGDGPGAFDGSVDGNLDGSPSIDATGADSSPGDGAAGGDGQGACDAGAPSAVLVAHTNATVSGEPRFVAALGAGVAWSGAPAAVFYCAASDACDADGGTVPLTFATTSILGLTAGGGVLAYVGDSVGMHCVPTDAGSAVCVTFAVPFINSRPPVIHAAQMFIDTEPGVGPAGIVSCPTAGICTGGLETTYFSPLTSRSTRLRISNDDAIWTDGQLRLQECALAGGCMPDAGGPTPLSTPASGIRVFDVATTGLIVAATPAGDLFACDKRPCSWRLLAHDTGEVGDLVVDEETGIADVIWSNKDGTVKACTLPGCPCVRTLATGITAADHLAVTSKFVYVTSTAQSGSIYRMTR